MVFELVDPFKSLWRKGYLQQHPSGRKYICLFNTDSDRTIISYARYLMSVKIGRLLPEGYEVDHIDNDETNDDINNLQILTSADNQLKRLWRQVENQVCYGYECAWCELAFILPAHEVNKRISTGVEMAFCTRRCAASYGHAYRKHVKSLNSEVGLMDQL